MGAVTPRPTRALTLHQPWATLITAGPKNVENRGWALRSGGFPQVLAIHAGQTEATLSGEIAEIADQLWPRWRRQAPRGAFVGAIEVVACVEFDAGAGGRLEGNPWAFGPICWLRGRHWILERPIPHRGAMSAWNIPPDVADAIAAGLIEVP